MLISSYKNCPVQVMELEFQTVFSPFNSLVGQSYQTATSHRTAIFRRPGDSNVFPFLFEGARVISKPPHDFGTFLDAYNFATTGGFRAEFHCVKEWFEFLEEAEATSHDKKLLAVFYRRAM